MSGREEKPTDRKFCPEGLNAGKGGRKPGPGRRKEGEGEGRTEGEQNQSLLCDRPERVRVREALSKSEPRDRDETIL